MPMLIVASPLWLAIHLGIAGTIVRRGVVAMFGEILFRAAFSVLSVLALAFLVWAYTVTPTTLVWVAPGWLRWILVFAMLPAFVLFVGSVSGRNPAIAAERGGEVQSTSGIMRVTRHPMMCSFTILAGVHVIGSGNTAAIVFFATFLVTTLAGMPSIDRKLEQKDPRLWERLSAETSIVPFLAIIQGRNRLRPREIGWLTPTIGVAAWIVLLVAHPWLFGVAPVSW